jgi:hypothetical protein
MAPTTPYSSYLGTRDPLTAMKDTLARIEALTRQWPADRFERTYAPGKWTARQVLVHLAQTEMTIGARARLALTTPEYVAQPFDQEKFMAKETTMGGPEAAGTFLALGRMNLRFFEGLSPDDRATSFGHPEYGSLTLDWIVHMMAGHQINHLLQLERIA